MRSLEEIRTYLERKKGQKERLELDLESLRTTIKTEERDLRQLEKAREIIKEISIKMQESLQYHISDITSMALEAVFKNPYALEVEFLQRRNRTECDLFFSRDEQKVDPLSAAGIGAVDVAAFALRCASWSMMSPRPRNVLILDEPFKYLKEEEPNVKVLQIARELSKKLNLQIIMISDERISREDIIENSDRVFEVTNRKGIAKVKVL